MKVLVRRMPEPCFTFRPLSDVHWPQHDHDKLELWREAVLADPHSVVTLGGDLFDFARGKYRKHLASYQEDGNSRDPLDEQAYAWVESFAEFLQPVASRIAAVVVGNHFWSFPTGRVSDQELALRLGRGDAFCGAFGMLRIDLPFRTKRSKYESVRIALHHDAGRRGGTAAADYRAFEHWSHAVESDIYTAGHTHRQWAMVAGARITVHADEDKVGDHKLVFVRSGAFMKGYGSEVAPEQPFKPAYAEVAMLPPSVLGIVSVGVGLTPKGRPWYELKQRTL